MNTHEREICDQFLNANILKEIVQPIKSGKEASVFLCLGTEFYQNKLYCLKIYKDFSQRSFKRNESYQDGRFNGCNGRDQRALKNKSSFGKAIMESSWLASEMEALTKLHKAGINVPKPIHSSGSAILMEYIGDQYQIANQLKDEDFFELKTKYLFKKIISYIQQMFNLDIVHGDLSAYNILVWKNKPVIIDFPQYIDPNINSEGFDILYRDVANICNFFEKKGIVSDSYKIAEQIWDGEKVVV